SLQIVLHLDAAGRQQALLESLAGLRFRELNHRWVPRLEARVLADPDQRRRSPIRGDLGIEQRVDAAEDQPRQVQVRDLKTLLQLGAVDLPPAGVDQDGEVLFDVGIALALLPLLEGRNRLLDGLALPLAAAGCEIGDAVVDAGDSGARGQLRSEPRLNVEEELRVLVAPRDPVLRR